MAFNYNRIAQTVIRLIKKFGKKCTFRGFVTVPNVNPSKPPVTTAVDRDYMAAFVGIDLEEIDGIRILTGDMRVLVQGNIDPSFKINGQVIDPDGVIWKVINLVPVCPGPVNVLWKVQVRK